MLLRELSRCEERKKGGEGLRVEAERSGRKRESPRLEKRFSLGPTGTARSVALELQTWRCCGQDQQGRSPQGGMVCCRGPQEGRQTRIWTPPCVDTHQQPESPPTLMSWLWPSPGIMVQPGGGGEAPEHVHRDSFSQCRGTLRGRNSVWKEKIRGYLEHLGFLRIKG